MALIRFPEGQQRSGSSGGIVFSHNRYGAYIRARSIPVNPNTDLQVAVRNAVRELSIAWENSLSQFQRDGWDLYGDNVNWQNAFGDTVKLTGLSQYIRSNTQRVQLGIARIDAAPRIFNLATAESALVGTASEATQEITITLDAGAAWAAESLAWEFIAMGMPQNGGIKFFNSPYRHLTAVPGGGPPVSPQVIVGVFPFAEGQRIWLRSRIVRADARLSEFAQTNFLAAA